MFNKIISHKQEDQAHMNCIDNRALSYPKFSDLYNLSQQISNSSQQQSGGQLSNQLCSLDKETRQKLQKYKATMCISTQKNMRLLENFKNTMIFVLAYFIFLWLLSYSIAYLNYDKNKIVTKLPSYYNFLPQQQSQKGIVFILINIFQAILLFCSCFIYNQYCQYSRVNKNVLIAGVQLTNLIYYIILYFNIIKEVSLSALCLNLVKCFGFIVTYAIISNRKNPKFGILSILILIFVLSQINFITLILKYVLLKNKTLYVQNYELSFHQIFILMMIVMLSVLKIKVCNNQIKINWGKHNFNKKLEPVFLLAFFILNMIMTANFVYGFLVRGYNQLRYWLFGEIDLKVWVFGIFGVSIISLFIATIVFANIILHNFQKMTLKKPKYVYLISENLLATNTCHQNQSVALGSCFICLSQTARFFYMQCGHLYCGNNCVVLNLEMSKSLRCPVCRKYSQYLSEIKQVPNIFGSPRKFEIISHYQLKI